MKEPCAVVKKLQEIRHSVRFNLYLCTNVADYHLQQHAVTTNLLSEFGPEVY